MSPFHLHGVGPLVLGCFLCMNAANLHAVIPFLRILWSEYSSSMKLLSASVHVSQAVYILMHVLCRGGAAMDCLGV